MASDEYRFRPEPTSKLTLDWVVRQLRQVQRAFHQVDEEKIDCQYCTNHYADTVGMYFGDGRTLTTSALSLIYPVPGFDALHKFELTLTNVGVSGTGGRLLIRIGSGSLDTTGYTSMAGTNADTTGFALSPAAGFDTGDTLSGCLTLSRTKADEWAISGVLHHYDSSTATSSTVPVAGYKSLGGTIDRVQIIEPTGNTLSGDYKQVYYNQRP